MTLIITLFYLWILNSFFHTFFKKKSQHPFIICFTWIIFYLLHYYGLSYITNPFAIVCSPGIPDTVNPCGTVALSVQSE